MRMGRSNTTSNDPVGGEERKYISKAWLLFVSAQHITAGDGIMYIIYRGPSPGFPLQLGGNGALHLRM